MRRRSGFTLIEIMVALVVGAIVVVGAREAFEALADQAERISAASAVADRAANADRALRELVGRLEVGTPEALHFAGVPDTATFASWCDVPGGWLEHCGVSLAIVRAPTGCSLIARTTLGDSLVLRTGFRDGAIRYLASPAAGGTWIWVWGSGITAPSAIGVMMDRDTLILRIGERG